MDKRKIFKAIDVKCICIFYRILFKDYPVYSSGILFKGYPTYNHGIYKEFNSRTKRPIIVKFSKKLNKLHQLFNRKFSRNICKDHQAYNRGFFQEIYYRNVGHILIFLVKDYHNLKCWIFLTKFYT